MFQVPAAPEPPAEPMIVMAAAARAASRCAKLPHSKVMEATKEKKQESAYGKGPGTRAT
jgi:hypothetical protein